MRIVLDVKKVVACSTAGCDALVDGGRRGTNGQPPLCPRCLATELRRQAGIAPRAPASRNGLRVRLTEEQTPLVIATAKKNKLTPVEWVRSLVDAQLGAASLTGATKPSKSRGRNRGTK